MKNELLFTEKQKFNQWYFWILFLVLNGYFLFLLINQILNNQSVSNSNGDIIALVLLLIFVILFSLFFLSIKLETIINTEGIKVRLYPSQIKYKSFLWEDISEYYVRKYSPILEYGGWGYRFGIKGNAYNISGNKGLQLVFKNKKKLLIGTKKPDELNEFLKNLEKYNTQLRNEKLNINI